MLQAGPYLFAQIGGADRLGISGSAFDGVESFLGQLGALALSGLDRLRADAENVNGTRISGGFREIELAGPGADVCLFRYTEYLTRSRANHY